MRLRRISGNSGFTLIELMITVTVFAILLALAAPSFVEFIDKAKLRGAADDLVSFVADARTESVKRNRDVNVAFGGSTTDWCVGANGAGETGWSVGQSVPAASACDCTTPSSCTVAGLQKTLSGSSYKGVVIDAVPGAVTFDSRLGAVTPLGTTAVTLTSPKALFKLKLTVSPLGQSTLCVPSGSTAIPGYSTCS